MQRSNPEMLIQGRLKWFDGRNGFGFVVDNASHVDVLLTLSTVLDFGWETVADGSWFEAYAFETERGSQISEILEIVPPSELGDGTFSGSVSPATLPGTYLPARVRWFDPDLGYGFVRASGHSEDCFLHRSALRGAGRLNVEAGETIHIRLGSNDHGKVATSIRPWTRSTDTDQSVVNNHLLAAA